MNISELSIRRPVLATVLTIIILLFGAIGYITLGVREYPSVDNPIISVTCSYAGANAEVIESQITEPLEQNINGIPGIRSLTSTSQQGMCRITVEFDLSVESFYQVNHPQAEQLYKEILQLSNLDKTKDALDLYCGVGAVGLCTAKNAGKLIGVEIIPQAVENAKQNAIKNGINNAEFICADATGAAEMLAKRGISPDVVMVDPPRKGCTPELISTVTEEMKPKKVVYISCDPATLSRDIAIFEEKGYKLIEIIPFDLFPRTPHVENVALLVR